MLNNISDISRSYFFTVDTLEQQNSQNTWHVSQTEEGVSNL